MVSGCSESCTGCMVGQQQESVECVSFCLFMVAWVWRDKRLAQDKSWICVYTFFQRRRKGRPLLSEAKPSGSSPFLQMLLRYSRFNRSYHFRVCWTMFLEMAEKQLQSSYICVIIQKLWNIGLSYIMVMHKYLTVVVCDSAVHWHELSWCRLHGWYFSMDSVTEALLKTAGCIFSCMFILFGYLLN